MVDYTVPLPAMETMSTSVSSKLRSVASVTVLPLLLLLLLFALGRGLDGIIADGKAAAPERSVKARHVNASPAAFGTQRALADRAGSMADAELD